MRRAFKVVGAIVILIGGAALVPNTRGLPLIDAPGRAVAVTTGGPWASMIYLARTDSGVIAIDLGWIGSGRALDDGLRRLGATRRDVHLVFVTHAHRDHLGAWPLVRHARFVVGAGDVPVLTGRARPAGPVARLAERMWRTHLPRADEIAITALSGDSIIALGSDTLRAYVIPGHTPGSTAYLFRGVLFAGDAVNWRPLAGFRGARPEMSGDVAQSRASVRALLERLTDREVRVLCSAHAKCAPIDATLRAAVTR